jgi:hypothetical protein
VVDQSEVSEEQLSINNYDGFKRRETGFDQCRLIRLPRHSHHGEFPPTSVSSASSKLFAFGLTKFYHLTVVS